MREKNMNENELCLLHKIRTDLSLLYDDVTGDVSDFKDYVRTVSGVVDMIDAHLKTVEFKAIKIKSKKYPEYGIYTMHVLKTPPDWGDGYDSWVEELGRATVVGSGETEQEAIDSCIECLDWVIEHWVERGFDFPKGEEENE